MRKIVYLLSLGFVISVSLAQLKLKPGFDAVEFAELLKVSAHQVDTPWVNVQLPYPDKYKMVYRSDTLGLANRWDLWVRDDSVAVISIRGTVPSFTSWLEDFYVPMVPAIGTLVLGNKNIFLYQLASDSNAYVHTGFLIGLAHLVPKIIEKINESRQNGIKDFIIMGHSQGGAIAFLLRSYLYYLQPGVIPDDVTFKTYSSAPPKPGNIFYAYDYELITGGGWSYRVVNVVDWIPQFPITVQTKFDFSKSSPFAAFDTSANFSSLNFIEKFLIGYAELEMSNALDEARDLIKRYLGEETYAMVKQKLPGFKEPDYVNSMYYMVCGTPVILRPGADYYAMFNKAQGNNRLFDNHFIGSYYYLLQKQYFDN